MLEQELAVSQRLSGDDHPSTLISMNNLALVLREVGKLQAAREPHEQVLAVQRRVLGDEHPDTLGSIYSLGKLLRAPQAEGDQSPESAQLRGIATVTALGRAARPPSPRPGPRRRRALAALRSAIAVKLCEPRSVTRLDSNTPVTMSVVRQTAHDRDHSSLVTRAVNTA
ncbi:tetratricopeptide repeat protein [Actinoplanes sp. NPDC048791]|uniref:tetratricopeptide repeat protein n=1 Tax=Actinoplanes sp. NPDC048791 TaxID=3154623 RepID=UPI0033ED6618